MYSTPTASNVKAQTILLIHWNTMLALANDIVVLIGYLVRDISQANVFQNLQGTTRFTIAWIEVMSKLRHLTSNTIKPKLIIANLRNVMFH